MSARDVLAEGIWRAVWSRNSPWSEADDAERVDVLEEADALLAAIRDMTPEQQAELIGGEVERRRAPYEHNSRVVGPWIEVHP